MQINSIYYNNYRQFKDNIIEFKESDEYNLHLIIGSNGVGKTTLLNSINWCLYGDEPHLSHDKETLPILNLSTIRESNEADIVDVIVSINANTENGKNITFTRTEKYMVYDTEAPIKKLPVLRKSKLEVKTVDEKNNTQIYEDEDMVELNVNRFVPSKLREYFFFDGERLERYFNEETAEKIENAAMAISEIESLKQMGKRLKNILDDYRKRARRESDDVNRIEEKIDKEEKNKKNIEKELKNIKEQIKKAEIRQDEISQTLSNSPNVESEEKRYKFLGDLIKDKEKTLNLVKEEKNDHLYELGKLLLVQKPIKKLKNIVKEMRENDELPPITDKDLLKTIIDEKFCKICERPLDENGLKAVEETIERLKVSTKIGSELDVTDKIISDVENRIKEEREIINQKTSRIQELESELKAHEKDRSDIDRLLEQHDVQKIKELHRERKDLDEAIKSQKNREGAKEEQLNRSVERLSGFIKERDKAMEQQDINAELRRKTKFLDKAINYTNKAKDTMVLDIKDKIETDTQKNFLSLVWKETTFESVEIDDEFNVKLIHKDGYSMLGSSSRAENELLALGFTMALHKVSGFDAPIIIDTPVARVSDINRENFGKSLVDLSKQKQLILLFTPDEYSDNISYVLDPKASSRHKLTLHKNEEEVLINEY